MEQFTRISRPVEFVEVVTLSRPSSLNALNTGLCQELAVHFAKYKTHRRTNPRAIIVTGEGRAFCAGADVKERKGIKIETWLRQHKHFERAARAIGGCLIPLIAAVNGPAVGGGCEVAIMADIIIASKAAYFAQPETRLGIIPGMGATQRLPLRIGLGRANEMLFTGRRVKAAEALLWGLVDHLASDDDLINVALAMASSIAAHAPIATREIKRATRFQFNKWFTAGYTEEIRSYKRALRSGERTEGMLAFFEKRTPRF